MVTHEKSSTPRPLRRCCLTSFSIFCTSSTPSRVSREMCSHSMHALHISTCLPCEARSGMLCQDTWTGLSPKGPAPAPPCKARPELLDPCATEMSVMPRTPRHPQTPVMLGTLGHQGGWTHGLEQGLAPANHSPPPHVLRGGRRLSGEKGKKNRECLAGRRHQHSSV